MIIIATKKELLELRNIIFMAIDESAEGLINDEGVDSKETYRVAVGIVKLIRKQFNFGGWKP
jgi:hypothetical protein